MKSALFKQKIQAHFLHSGFLAFVVYLFLASASLAQAADTRIAFMSTRNMDWDAEIYLMTPDGDQIRRLTEQPKADVEPAWSPDGKRITFVSYRDLKQIPERGVIRGEIYVMNADGTNPINLTRSVDRADRVEARTEVHVFRGDSFLGAYHPRRDFYPSFNLASTQAAIRSTPVEDLYIIPGEILDDGRVVFRIFVNPLVMWMWVAGPLLVVGVLVALWPQTEPAILYARSGIGDVAARPGAVAP